MDDDFDNPELLAAVQAAEKRFQAGSSATPAKTSAPSPNTQAPVNAGKVVQPKPQALPQRALPSAILVSTRQKGNPILTHISGVAWEYTDTPADYVVGRTTCALFLSLKYHRLHPEYIYGRIRALAGQYDLRVLLCMVDIENHEEPLRELAKTALVNDLTLVLAWSAREAARYLEAYKALERSDGSGIRGARATTFADQMTDFVTTPRGVNRTDAVSLVGTFGSVRNAVNSDRDSITAIPGWGERKADRFLGTVNEPFRTGRSLARPARRFEGAGNEPLRISMLKAKEVSDIMASRENSTGDAQGTKRGRNEDQEANEDHQTWEPDEDEQEALFVAENTHAEPTVAPAKNAGASTSTTAVTSEGGGNRSKKTKEPELSEGVQAALEKLRNQ